MGHQIIEQPNGKFALWSSVVNNFLVLDCSPQEIIREEIKRERKRITSNVNKITGLLKQGGKPYHQFTKTWKGCLNTVRQNHGEKATTKIKEILNTKEIGCYKHKIEIGEDIKE